MPDPSISEFMARMASAFAPEKAVDIDADIQFKVSGVQAANWNVTIKDARCTVSQGTAPASKLTVSADSADFLKIFSGDLDVMQVIMQSRLKVTGDMSLAMKLMG